MRKQVKAYLFAGITSYDHFRVVYRDTLILTQTTSGK